jgi:hypothetical protein
MTTPTMTASLIRLMKRKWVTPAIAASELQCYCLSQRCGDFIRDGLRVVKRKVPTSRGGICVAYRIVGGK